MNWLQSVLNNFTALFRWYFMVAPWEQCIRVRLGKHTKVYGPGCHFKVPFIDLLFKQGIRSRVICLPALTLTTADGKTVTCSGNLQFKVVDILQLYNSVHMPDEVLQTHTSGLLSRYITENNAARLSVEDACTYVRGNLELGKYGLQADEFMLTDFAFVRTYRLIQDHLEKFNRFELDVTSPAPENKYADSITV